MNLKKVDKVFAKVHLQICKFLRKSTLSWFMINGLVLVIIELNLFVELISLNFSEVVKHWRHWCSPKRSGIFQGSSPNVGSKVILKSKIIFIKRKMTFLWYKINVSIVKINLYFLRNLPSPSPDRKDFKPINFDSNSLKRSKRSVSELIN